MTNQDKVEIIIYNLMNLLENDLENIEYYVLDDTEYKEQNGTIILINGLDTKSIFFPDIKDSNFEVLVFNKDINDDVIPKLHYKDIIENRFQIENELVEILKDEDEGLDLYRTNLDR